MIEVIDCVQGSPEWFKARLGVVTASEFSTVLAKGVGGKGDSKERRKYMLKLIGEQMTGEVADSYSNAHMERGKVMEDEAHDYYVLVTDEVLQRVGFIRKGRIGCSPDSLIGNSGMYEAKTKLPHLQLEVILRGELPPEHKAQCQGGLWVCEREWIDFHSYWPKMPSFIKRVYRDEEYIKTIEQAVKDFLEEMDQISDQIRKAA